MAKVIMEGWRDGLEKVSLTKLQVDSLGMSLKESKSNVDSLLDGKAVVLEIEDANLAREFLNRADKIGVDCKLTM